MAADGTVTEVGNEFVLRFEREFPHSVDKVWAALTEPAQLAQWLGGAGSVIDLRIGGRVHLAGHGAEGIESTITALDPPNVIEFGWKTSQWDGGPIRWELSPTAKGTHLVFTHTHPSLEYAANVEVPPEVEGTDPIARTLAGWHTLFEQLANLLDGHPMRFGLERWWPHYDRYNAKVSSSSR
jgi:uncharacterized protein YndB with AHSA1/START domain